MENQVAGRVIGIPISCPNENTSSSNPSLALTHNKVDRMKHMMNKHEKKANILCIESENMASSFSLLKGLPFAVRDPSNALLQWELIRFHYKVSIPLGKIERVDQRVNTTNQSQKYMEIVTVDNLSSGLWGLNYQKAIIFSTRHSLNLE
ncbi:GEM-like protein 4 [Vitis vinifera]|uniref:GEM-like protein 4 n=1 Tax=Vitis vinifera TaxID=29760 RepID=A0A438EUV5_VITVI|nr:GEM-like protein 4 [Vitis vinifera]